MGEAEFGLDDGVIGTRAAWVDGKEVVEVRYDPKRTSFTKLAKRAHGKGNDFFACPSDDAQRKTAESVFGDAGHAIQGTLRDDKDPKYYLGRTELRHVPMTEAQAVRINAHLDAKTDYVRFLSPRQQEQLQAVRKHPKWSWPNVIGVELSEAWRQVRAVRASKARSPAKSAGSRTSNGR